MFLTVSENKASISIDYEKKQKNTPQRRLITPQKLIVVL